MPPPPPIYGQLLYRSMSDINDNLEYSRHVCYNNRSIYYPPITRKQANATIYDTYIINATTSPWHRCHYTGDKHTDKHTVSKLDVKL